MVTVMLTDGMGNQMFQYALGRAVSHRRATTLALDASWFKSNTFRKYSLGVFNIAENFSSDGYPGFCRARVLARRLGIPGIRPIVRQRGAAFDAAVLDAPGDAYLTGFWQSERYFKEIEDTIRRDFSFKSDPVGENAATAAAIRAVNSVAVLVRRGDYVTNPSLNRVFGTCSPEYYRDGARFVASQAGNLHFFVFSDDLDWARTNLALPGPATFVAQKDPEKAYEGVRLMSLCRHHIIANSTFGWWGAWLANSEGIVVAPRQWFKSEEFDGRDIVPSRWVRI